MLQSEDATASEKTDALKFLVHFVGDVHQPLHVSRAKDKGGNDIKVEFFHNRTNLHRLWDSGLTRRTKKSWSVYAAELQQAITHEQLKAWSSTDPVEWATESYRLALSHAYAIPGDGQLGQAYFDRCIPVVNQRLAMAGVRLAVVLNRIFADGAGVSLGPETSPTREPAAGPAFVGSRRSGVYHYPGCSVVKRIKPENLVEYATAPRASGYTRGAQQDKREVHHYSRDDQGKA